MKRSWEGVLVALVTSMFAMPALALQWTWVNDNISGNVVSPNTQDVITTNPDSTNCQGAAGTPSNNRCEQFTVTVGSGSDQQVLKVRAYSTATVQNSSTNPTGQWITADLANYAGGFGVKNRVSGDTNEGVDPEHATDNNQVVDLLVFELPAGQVWDLDAFRLGWANEVGGSGTESRADVQAWFGGAGLASNFDFTKVCFTGCSGSGISTLAALDGGSFARLDGTAFNGENVVQGQTMSVTGTQAGRYLVMSGQLGEQNDHFKLEMLKATGTNGGGQTPVPGTLALLGLGLVGLRSLRRGSAR